ncbi:MAG: ABC transporter permease, partial [Acidobacteriota bacterium]
MARLAAMLGKDLRRRIRSPVGLIVMLIFPLAFASLIGVSFGPGSDDDQGQFKIKMLMVDHDEGFFSGFLANASRNEEFKKWFQVEELDDEAEARRRMEEGEASALLIIPAGFSEDLLDQKPVELKLVKNPAQSILPRVAEESVRVGTVMLDGSVRLMGTSLKKVGEAFQGEDDDDFEIPVDSLLTPLILELAGRIRPMAHYLFPPLVTFANVEEESVPLSILLAAAAGDTAGDLKARAEALAPEDAKPGQEEESGFNLFGFMLPMVSLISILFLGENGMRDLLTEQAAGTLTRQFVSPVGLARVLLAKVLS